MNKIINIQNTKTKESFDKDDKLETKLRRIQAIYGKKFTFVSANGIYKLSWFIQRRLRQMFNR